MTLLKEDTLKVLKSTLNQKTHLCRGTVLLENSFCIKNEQNCNARTVAC